MTETAVATWATAANRYKRQLFLRDVLDSAFSQALFLAFAIIVNRDANGYYDKASGGMQFAPAPGTGLQGAGWVKLCNMKVGLKGTGRGGHWQAFSGIGFLRSTYHHDCPSGNQVFLDLSLASTAILFGNVLWRVVIAAFLCTQSAGVSNRAQVSLGTILSIFEPVSGHAVLRSGLKECSASTQHAEGGTAEALQKGRKPKAAFINMLTWLGFDIPALILYIGCLSHANQFLVVYESFNALLSVCFIATLLHCIKHVEAHFADRGFAPSHATGHQAVHRPWECLCCGVRCAADDAPQALYVPQPGAGDFEGEGLGERNLAAISDGTFASFTNGNAMPVPADASQEQTANIASEHQYDTVENVQASNHPQYDIVDDALTFAARGGLATTQYSDGTNSRA